MPKLPAERAAPTIAFEVSSLLVERPTGVATYGAGLIRALRQLRPEQEYLQVYRWARRRNRRYLPAPEAPSRGYLWPDWFWPLGLPRRTRLLHTLDTRIPANYQGPLVATLFDVISALPQANEGGWSSERFRRRKLDDYRRMALQASVVVTLSQETRSRFRDLFEPECPVEVIPPGIDEAFFQAAALRRRRRSEGGEGRPYLLFVGLLCARKNLKQLVALYDTLQETHPRLMLRLAGPIDEDDPEGTDWRGIGIQVMRYVSRERLLELYAGAEALVYLSHYEGFGLPVLEAMAVGVPVVASNRGGIPEAAGDAALLVDPDRLPMAVEATKRILDDPDFAASLAARGIERAQRFTWRAAAERVASIHGDVLDRHGFRERR